MLDTTQIVVSILGLGLIAGVFAFFFGKKRRGQGAAGRRPAGDV